jgi:hypothetical protein
VTSSRLRVRRPHAPGDYIEFYFLPVTNFCQSVWMQQGTDLFTPKGGMLSKANKLHDYHTYKMGVHSCLATSSWLYYAPQPCCAFVLQYYHLRRGCVGTCE